MVLVHRGVGFVDEVEALIQEKRGPSLDPATTKSIVSTIEMQQDRARHRAEAEIAFQELRKRKASRPTSAAARKEPITFACDSD